MIETMEKDLGFSSESPMADVWGEYRPTHIGLMDLLDLRALG